MNYDSYRTIMKTDLINGMQTSGKWELATIYKTNAYPKNLISFDNAICNKNLTGWVHFFIHDSRFFRILNDPWRYFQFLSKFEGVISPDFSVFWEYPIYRQLQSIALSRELGAWMQRNGIPVIPCVRWGKENTYNFAFDGIEPGGTIAVGTVGAMREKQSRNVFENGFEPMLEALFPKRIIVYGSRRSSVFDNAEADGIEIIQFDSNTAKAFINKGE